MKHLRRFNESVLPYYLAVKDIQDFCEMYLAYLVDDGFNITDQPGYNDKGRYTTICFNKTYNRPVVIFSWNEINLSQILEDKVSLEELTQINIYFK